MASVRREAVIDAPPEDVWAAVRDFGKVHERLAPGFVVAAELDGDSRVVTFSNGAVVLERLVGIDDDARRLAYTAVDAFAGRATHHSASAQVLATPGGGTRFVWITDVLPDELATRVAGMMDQGLAAIRDTLTRDTARRNPIHPGSA